MEVLDEGSELWEKNFKISDNKVWQNNLNNIPTKNIEFENPELPKEE